MAKIVRLIFLFIVTTGICFGFEARIKKFDDTFAKANKNAKLELHQDMKSLYVKSIIDNNDKAKLEALKRVIQSAKVLGLGVEPYEKELATMSGAKTANNNTKVSTAQSAKQNVKNEQKSSNSSKTAGAKKSLQILSIIKNSNNLEIKFSGPIEKGDIKYLKLKSKTAFRNVYDFKGVWISKSQTFKNIISSEIRVSQFDKDTVRVVFSNKTDQKLDFVINGNSIFFALAGTKLNTSNSTKKESKGSTKISDIKTSNTATKTNQNTKTTANTKTTKSKPVISGKVIVIDAGHGGDDPGAVNGKLQEKKIVLSISLKAGEELKKRGYKVYYTRSNDKFINLRSRTKFANDKSADLFISIHANAAPNKEKAKTMHGIETFFLSPARSERSKNVAALENKSDVDEMNYFSKQTFLNFLNREKIIASNKLAIDIQRNVLSSAKKINSKVVDGGVREAPFWVLVGALMPAVLLEVGYITHPSEGPLMSKTNYQNAIAKGIADGIDQYFANQQK